jgi:hypothetical protein
MEKGWVWWYTTVIPMTVGGLRQELFGGQKRKHYLQNKQSKKG